MKNFIIDDFKDDVDDIINRFKNKKDFTFYTSDSTAEPKKIVHSFEVMKMAVENNIENFQIDKTSYILANLMPPRTIGFAILQVLPAYLTEATIRIKKFEFKKVVKELSNDVTHSIMVPNVYRLLLKTKDWKEANFSNIETILMGSDILPEGSKNEWLSKGIKKFAHVYGSTEVPPAVFVSDDEKYMKNKISKDIDYYFEDDGELCCKWKNQKEYWKSGDIFADESYIMGRKKNIVKLNCSHVFPETIEKYIMDNLNNVNRCLAMVNDSKLKIFYEGENCDSKIKKLIKNFFPDEDKVSIKIKNVEQLKTNSLNKIIRNQEIYA